MIMAGAFVNPYVPDPAEVIFATREAADIQTYRFELCGNRGPWSYAPGQFAVLSVLGVGECPITISSSPTDGPWLELTIRRVGKVTAALYRGPSAGAIGLRGPLGQGFHLEGLQGRAMVCVAGGIGLAPLRSLIHLVNARRSEFGPLAVLYGAATPGRRLYKDELQSWQLIPGNAVLQVVDADPEGVWHGAIGRVTALIGGLESSFKDAAAVVCGPPPMVAPVVGALEDQGIAAGDIQVALERRMSCGVGKCGHCYVGERLVCVDGPVFTAQQLRDLGEQV